MELPSTFAIALWCAAAGCAVGAACLVPPRALPEASRPKATLPGCGKDTDCKGSRICVRSQCLDPPPRPAVLPVIGIVRTDGGAPDAAPAKPAIVLPGISPLFHGDWAHTGRSRFLAPATEPTVRLTVPTQGVVVSSPAIADDGTAFFGSHDHLIRAVAPDGSVKWTRSTGDLVWCSPALGPGGALYVGSDDDQLYALDAASGVVRWTFTAGPCKHPGGVGPEASRCDVDGVTVGPDGTIYLVADGAYALAPDGTVKFRFRLGTHCAGAPAIGPDGTIYIGCQDGALYALAPDGIKRWEFRAGDDLDASPAVGADGTVYVGSDDHKLYALGPGGAVKWAVQTGGDVRSSPAIARDGTIYVGSFDGSLYAIHPDGTIAWTFRAADRILSSPAIDADGLILIGSEDDRLYALHPDGKLAFSVLFDGDVDGTPAIGPGTIYIGTDDKALHILR